jgi:transcriptional regulator with XRE-family HTH domain
MEFRVHLQALRHRAQLTQRALAEVSGIPLRTIQSWEIGRYRPTIDVLRPLAEALGISLEELVPAKKSSKRSAKPQARKRPLAKVARPRRPVEPSQLSALDAAAKVLGETGKALNCRELIEAMAAKGYWRSPGGRTPWATLYASIIKEIAAKGSRARFKKTDRGKFVRR